MTTEERIKNDITDSIEKYLKSLNIRYKRHGKTLDEIYDNSVLELLNICDKFVSNKPRKVYYSKELIEKINNESNGKLRTLVYTFENKFLTGENINGFLSTKIFNSEYQDLLFNVWNMKHIHLSDKEATSKTAMKKNRSENLLICIINESEVYFLDVINHPDNNSEFISLSFLNIISSNNWMEELGFIEVKGCLGLSFEIENDKDLYDLYNNKINYSMFMFKDKYYFVGQGISCSGHKSEHCRELCNLNRNIYKVSQTEGEYIGFKLILNNILGMASFKVDDKIINVPIS